MTYSASGGVTMKFPRKGKVTAAADCPHTPADGRFTYVLDGERIHRSADGFWEDLNAAAETFLRANEEESAFYAEYEQAREAQFQWETFVVSSCSAASAAELQEFKAEHDGLIARKQTAYNAWTGAQRDQNTSRRVLNEMLKPLPRLRVCLHTPAGSVAVMADANSSSATIERIKPEANHARVD